MKQNLHIHTSYSDGRNAPEEIVLKAIEKGFDSIGFSEHTYMEFSDYPYQMTVEDMPNYRNEILTLKEKYKNCVMYPIHTTDESQKLAVESGINILNDGDILYL